MPFFVFFTLIGDKFTKTKFHSIWEKGGGEREYRDGLNEPD